MNKRVLDTKEAAEFLGVSESWMNHSRCGVKKRRPPYTKIGKRVVYRISDLEKYQAENLR